MAFFEVVIASDLGEVLILASVLASILACLILYRSIVCPGSSGTAIMSISFLPNSMQLLFLVFPGLLGGPGSLFGRACLTLALTL